MAEAERPFGDLYTQRDYNFLAAMSDKIGMKRTPREESETSVLLRTIYSVISSEQESRYDQLIREIEMQDGLEVNISQRENPEKFVDLTSSPIDLSVAQGERKTRIYFEPKTGLGFDPFFMYDHFFGKIPNALYGNGKDAPTPEHIKESTKVSVMDRAKNQIRFNLQFPRGRERFEEMMKVPEEIDSVLFFCDGQGVSYSMQFPNVQEKKRRYVQFTFPSNIPITEDMLDILLTMHKDGWKLNGDNKSYAKSFTSAINRIREGFRVR